MDITKLCAELAKTNDTFTIADIQAAAARVDAADAAPKGKNDAAPKKPGKNDAASEAE